jgi:hypothetical protein
MMTVVDHVKPWLMPSRRFANRIQFPARRPPQKEGDRDSDQPPGHQDVFATQTVRQSAGAVIGERLRHTEDHDERQHAGTRGEQELCSAIAGRMLRSMPAMAPTKAFTTTSSAN